jgi:glycosyltransferase involved in cell wall biosynthesis
VTPVERVSTAGPAPAGPWRPAVDAWFARNTLHARAYSDLDVLAALKRRAGLTISLGLPALNEEDTIGREIAVLRRALMEEVPLLDEIAVIDSGSSDRTVAVARGLGVPAYQHAEILPEAGTYDGKGEALWKSLHALRGDLIVWLDTDIRNIHPQFVYGLIGPLLHDPRIGYVKGFYQRPLHDGSQHSSTGGGRVTELTARPLLNLFFPELSGVIQPLSGEYAGRRELLERLPFFTGYGVEIGHLIDILVRFGLDRIGQVDLDTRVHRNRELGSLSLMAFALVQVVMARVGDRAGYPLREQMNTAMKFIRTSPSPALDVKELRERERPPILTIPAYRRQRAVRQPAAGVTWRRASAPWRPQGSAGGPSAAGASPLG